MAELETNDRSKHSAICINDCTFSFSVGHPWACWMVNNCTYIYLWKATHRIHSPMMLYVIFIVHVFFCVSENAIEWSFSSPTILSNRMIKSNILCCNWMHIRFKLLLFCSYALFRPRRKGYLHETIHQTYMADAWWIVHFSSLNFRHRFFKLNLCFISIIIHVNRCLFISLCIVVWRCGWLWCVCFDKI